jgi:hypothetical protein
MAAIAPAAEACVGRDVVVPRIGDRATARKLNVSLFDIQELRNDSNCPNEEVVA